MKQSHLKQALAFCAACLFFIMVKGQQHGKPILQVKQTAALFWFADTSKSPELRTTFLHLLDTCQNIGLNKNKYNFSFISTHVRLQKSDSANISKIDAVYAKAAFSFCHDVYAGDISGYLSYDEVSAKYAVHDKDYIAKRLENVSTATSLVELVDGLQPEYAQYKQIKKELDSAIKHNAVTNIKKLTSQINYLRWIAHFNFQRFILVNIPSGTLDLYRNDSAILTMRVVVGKPSTKTPRFAAYCTEVVVYPYWNVPSSIGLHELLPQFKRSPALVDGMNMQVIDANGAVINHHKIDWASYNGSNFPYRFRQSTGCDNALGVIKFNLTDPFNVYMHDTNNKLAFLLGARYLSHGCIRVEKPRALADEILPQKLDSSFITACLKNEKPSTASLSEPIPVLVTYMIVEPGALGPVRFYKDVYSLFK